MNLKTTPLLRRAALCLGMAAALTLPDTAYPAILAQYAFAGTLASTDSEPNSTAGPVGFSGGTVDSTIGLSGSQHVYFRGAALTGTTAGAILDNDYFTFTLTPNVGSSFQLQTLTFDLGGTDSTGSAFNAQIGVYSSADGFTTSLGSATYTVAASSGISYGPTTTITLTSLAPITSSAPLEIRLYSSVTSPGQNNAILRLDNIQLNGDLVPEPTVGMLGLLAGISALGIRRRRWQY